MRELTSNEIEPVSGGISGYEAAGAILAVTAAGSLAGPIGPVVLGIAYGSAGGMAISQLWANISLR